MDKKQAKVGPGNVRVVGIGASAGGIEAIVGLLDFLPENTGMAFVFIQHLSPYGDSSLPAILRKHTKMPVVQVEKATPVKPGHIYVIAPNTILTLADHMLVSSPVTTEQQIGSTINVFFSSLAKAQKEQAIGVILSGADTDGTEGIKAIKAAGGIVFAQTPESAKFDVTLQTAIATALIDHVCPPEEIGKQLGRLVAAGDADETLPSDGKAWAELLDLLKKSSGIDFASYKELSVSRRILRRMGLTKNATLPEYVRFATEQPAELRNLEQELLINYTSFFRDPAVFEIVKTKLFPELFKSRLPSDPIRLWIPGCSTGEEAYSFAIILNELMESHEWANPVQIFASDADDEAIERARLGVYPKSVADDVSPHRLSKFFIETDKGYKLTGEIRSKCIFSKQNIISDPPFSHIDLISCRNVLIYFRASLQKQTLLRFHYALQPDGFLVLGKSESTSNLADYFEPFLNRDKIYRKKNTTPNIATNLFEPATFISRIKADQTGGAAMQKKSRLETVIEKEVLDRYGPVGVVVDENMEVVQVRGRTGEFLSLASGKPSLNLLKMIREELSLDMFHALQQAKTTKAFVRTPQIPVGSGGDTVSIEVVPITGDNDAESYLLVFFDKAGRARANTAEAAGPEEPVTADWRRQQEELAATQEYMKSVIFQYETNSEQLRTANEEVQSSNEELQTMNEELETAKEELQSTNEELVTLNEELQSRNEDLRNANSDIQNVLRSIGTSILMLDGDLRIRRFNPGAEWLFNLIQTDLGRPISNLRYNLRLADFEKKIKKAIGDIVLVEEEVVADSGEWYLMQIRPYRTIDNQIDGAVILFTDITSMRRNLDASRSALVLTERIVETMPDPLVILQPDLRIKSANKAFYETVKASAADTLNKYIYDLDNGLWNSPALRELLNDLAAKTAAARDASFGWESPDLGRRTVAVNARRTIEEGPANDFIVVLARDITSGK